MVIQPSAPPPPPGATTVVVQQQPPPPPIAVAAPGQTVVVTGPPTYVPPARTNVVVRERVVVQERVRYIQCFEGPYSCLGAGCYLIQPYRNTVKMVEMKYSMRQSDCFKTPS